MKTVSINTTNKAVKAYFSEIERITQQQQLFNEGQVAPPFATLLNHYGRQLDYTFAQEFRMKGKTKSGIRVDGAMLSPFKLVQGIWEAKDGKDDLATEVKKKFALGYPKENILFQAPDRAIIWQNGREVMDVDISTPEMLVEVVKTFLEYQPPLVHEWEKAADEFRDKVPQLAHGLQDLIHNERTTNKRFVQAFTEFKELVQQAINPNISEAAVEEMLIQHLLTERIFRKVFNNPDFAQRNIIAREIEKVIQALTWGYRSRADFMAELDRFYGAIESTAATIDGYSDKQDFLNTVYEKFFQGFSVDVADTHGIVYTPQPIVDFMVRSVEDILQTEFGRSLADEGVHVLDPFVGTGNFMLRVMHQIAATSRMKLPQKYASELHCNEVMLLPYYIASMNIENAYYELTGRYEPFEGIVLVDTFELTEGKQRAFDFFVKENTERARAQMQQDLTVIIGNPPYNVGQVNENDNNKNRQYPEIDQRIRETYAKDSRATNKNALGDVYVKAIRWASDRIGESGIVAYVTNNSFIEALSFDGMRKHIQQDFNAVYVLDLRGNIRKDSMRDGIPLGEKHTVFGMAAMVGVTVTFFVRHPKSEKHNIYYHTVDFRATREEKFALIEKSGVASKVEWQLIKPNKRHTWLTAGLHADFDDLLPMGTKEAKRGQGNAIFIDYSIGVQTARDAWAYNFSLEELKQNMKRTIEVYNREVLRFHAIPESDRRSIDESVDADTTQISWSRNLKRDFKRAKMAEFSNDKLRRAVYRPFTKQHLFFDRIMNQEVGQLPKYYPDTNSTNDNRIISVTDRGAEKPFMVLLSDTLPDYHIVGAGCVAQCFPFYVYDEDGSNRRENITDWALQEFRDEYDDATISKWDIFYYIYALLHHPAYRDKYKENLKRQLPRIPFAPDFRAFAEAGQQLATLHVEYEDQPEYKLKRIENPDAPKMTGYVEKMKLSRDKSRLEYNDFLTLTDIPPEAHEYKLGNRSALEWIVDRYQVKTDKRSGITNDPNQYSDDEWYILKLIGKVVHVSVETVRIVKALPSLE